MSIEEIEAGMEEAPPSRRKTGLDLGKGPNRIVEIGDPIRDQDSLTDLPGFEVRRPRDRTELVAELFGSETSRIGSAAGEVREQ